MQIHNASSSIITLGDMPSNQSNDMGYPPMGLILQPGATVTVNDTDADKSNQLGALIYAGLITITGSAEPTTGQPQSVGLYALYLAVNALADRVYALEHP